MTMDADIVSALDRDSLDKLARHYETMARRMRLRVAELDRRAEMAREVRERRSDAHRAARMALEYIRGGMAAETAIRAAWRQSGVPQTQIGSILRRLRIEGDRQARETRRMEVARLARAGLSNLEIARELGVHRNTVSNDIKALFRR